MLTQKRKNILVPLVVLGGIMAVACLAKSVSSEPVAAKSLPDAYYSMPSNDSNFSVPQSGSFSTREMFSKMILSVLIVIILGIAAVYASKKFLPKIVNLPGKKIKVIESVALGPHKTLHLVEINNRQFLIGSTLENITKLADVTNPSKDMSDIELEND
jgi:flagellar biosynthetic protein FliO